MDYRELQRIIDITTAMRDGKRIQAKMIWNGSKIVEDGEWFDMEGPRLNWQQYDYRIAPQVCEPRKAREYLISHAQSNGVMLAHEIVPGNNNTNMIHVREVLPEDRKGMYEIQSDGTFKKL